MMTQETADPKYMASVYFDYQKRYASSMRESDKVMLALMKNALADVSARCGRLLDIGCSNGNLLRHLREIAPAIEYWGGDIQDEVVQRCREDADLSGIRFEEMNIRDLAGWPPFDIIVANAVLGRFSPADFELICSKISKSLHRKGYFFAWDWYHKFDQELTTVDRSSWHPEGLVLHMRSMNYTRGVLKKSGFDLVEFHPFDILIDLPTPKDQQDMSTYTMRTTEGARLQFRGCLYQPWCHLIARKA